jgi:hypothetical protein
MVNKLVIEYSKFYELLQFKYQEDLFYFIYFSYSKKSTNHVTLSLDFL